MKIILEIEPEELTELMKANTEIAAKVVEKVTEQYTERLFESNPLAWMTPYTRGGK